MPRARCPGGVSGRAGAPSAAQLRSTAGSRGLPANRQEDELLLQVGKCFGNVQGGVEGPACSVGFLRDLFMVSVL